MKHILVVDDDRLNLVLAYDTLKSFYSVSVVNSGIQALKFLESAEDLYQKSVIAGVKSIVDLTSMLMHNFPQNPYINSNLIIILQLNPHI